ncbi:MAG TPA: HAMP domain-containing sensor histidine kinase [Baekduia sp.]|nr:HAMP domain-containing sensor histidine kinase [Baekduia sp.]
MRRLSGLRPRITLLVVSVVALCLAAGFAAVYRGTISKLRSGTDHGLREDLQALRARVDARRPDAITAEARRYIAAQSFRPTTHVVFVEPPGRPVVTNVPELLDLAGGDPDDTPAERREESANARQVLTQAPGFSDRHLPGVGPVRLLVATETTPAGTVRFGVAEPTQPTERARETMERAFLLAGALGMALALAGGLLVASRVANPLRRIARVAQRVDAGDLSPRMELDGRHDEVRVLAHSFDQMLARLQDAFDRQSAFIADASHELRTPLTIVRGQLEVLAMEEHPSGAEVREVERTVRMEIDRMSRLVEDLVLLAHAEDERFLRPEPIDLPDFLTGICDGLRPTADRRLELAPVPPVVLEADPDRLAQALRNLLRNAIVHTDPGGLVRLSAEQRDGVVRLLVDDDGPGIAPEDRERVFDRLARLDSARGRDQGGAGLGLAIVRAIAEAHGGEVWIERSPVGGARFVVELPAEGPATA